MAAAIARMEGIDLFGLIHDGHTHFGSWGGVDDGHSIRDYIAFCGPVVLIEQSTLGAARADAES